MKPTSKVENDVIILSNITDYPRYILVNLRETLKIP